MRARYGDYMIELYSILNKSHLVHGLKYFFEILIGEFLTFITFFKGLGLKNPA
jgi:hypothetical protein